MSYKTYKSHVIHLGVDEFVWRRKNYVNIYSLYRYVCTVSSTFIREQTLLDHSFRKLTIIFPGIPVYQLDFFFELSLEILLFRNI